MFRQRKIQGILETTNVKSLSEKIEQLITDNEYFKQKQEESDKKNRSIFKKIKDSWKSE